MIQFYSRSRSHKELSNFFVASITILDTTFITGEHAFHYFKYTIVSDALEKQEGANGRRDRVRILRDYADGFKGVSPSFETPNLAKKSGGKKGLRLTPREIGIWNKESSGVQHMICLAKIRQHPDISTCVCDTREEYLLHFELGRQPFWGGRIDKKSGEMIGENRLGLIWMNIRKSIRQG